MNEKLLYAIGTLLTWGAWFFAFRFVVLGVGMLVHSPGADRKRSARGLITVAVAAAFLFVLGSAVPAKAASSAVGPIQWRFPLTWFVMPFSAWLTVAAIAAIVIRLLQGGLAINAVERLERFKAAGIWFVTALVGFWLYKRDPADTITILTGGVTLDPGRAVAIVLVVLAATVAMVVAGREATTRGYAESVVTQLTLLVGSVVFGLPFVFLLITSFKEPLDMSSPNGIVWVPKVSQTVKYMDPRDPQYQTDFKGSPVVADIVGKNRDGTVQMNVLRPMSIAGASFDANPSTLKEVARDAALVTGTLKGVAFEGVVIEEMQDGHRRVQFNTPPQLKGQVHVFSPTDLAPVRKVGLNISNYPQALEFLPPEADGGLVYLKNTLIIVILGVVGTLLSSAVVAYAFSRMSFPGKNTLFAIMLSTMMLPAAVTLLPTFLIFRDLHAIDTLIPLWAPAFFGSAFNIFLLRQFFMQIPMELEDAAKIDGCSYLKTFWQIMMPQIKPALAVIAIWTFLGAWNNFMGPLIYINSPEHMPLSYALQLFQNDRGTDEPGLVMAFATMCMAPVLLLFFFAQRYFIEGVTLSGLGGR